jgi:alpha-mannosidase
VYEDGTIALTLLRAVGWLSRDDLWVRRIAAGPLVPTPGAQCFGDYTYEYAILPHSGGWQAVYAAAYGYTAPLLGRRADTHSGLELREMNITRDDPALVSQADWPRGGVLPESFSFVQFDAPELILSAVYRSGAALIVRCYNISQQPVSGTLRLGLPIRAAYHVNMAEDFLETLPVQDDHSINITLRGGEVYTVKVLPRA